MAKKIKLDFTDVSDGFTKVNKIGTYLFKIAKVEAKRGATSGKPYLTWELEVLQGEFKGAKMWYNTSLQKQSLFSLRDLLTAAGITVPKSVVSIDLDTVIGKVVSGKVIQETYKGEEKFTVKEVFKANMKSVKDDDDLMDLAGLEEELDDEDDEIDLEGIDLDE